jgi:hypothetical protein
MRPHNIYIVAGERDTRTFVLLAFCNIINILQKSILHDEIVVYQISVFVCINDIYLVFTIILTTHSLYVLMLTVTVNHCVAYSRK